MENSTRGLRLSTKTLFMILAFLVVFTGTSLTSVFMSQSMTSQVTTMSNQNYKVSQIANALDIAFYEIDDNMAFLVGLGKNPDKTIAKQQYAAIQSGITHYNTAWAQLSDPDARE